ncbi:MAG: phosphate ABC transporter permease PstA [Rhodospirillaceae bacterium]|nr:phosphate ABC transporter permease PstA [Rhodospirillaceae bacterium]
MGVIAETTQENRTPAAVGAAIRRTDMRARGEPALWVLGGALALGIAMIAGFLALVAWNGILTFIPKPIDVVTQADGTVTAGEPFREELFRPDAEVLEALTPEWRARIAAADGYTSRTLYRTGNFDLYGEDFRWIPDFTVTKRERPANVLFIERLEWGPFVGSIKSATIDGAERQIASLDDPAFVAAHRMSRQRWAQANDIEKDEIGAINHKLEAARLDLRGVELDSGRDSTDYRQAQARVEADAAVQRGNYDKLAVQVEDLRRLNAANTVTFVAVGGEEKTEEMAHLVRFYPANDLSFGGKIAVYFSRWAEFLGDEPREANTEGGVLPAIFGTAAMTLLMVIAVAPFGVMTALYLREYAKQGRLVSIVRISVNNLAGVPSIVYGVFGLGFFAYTLGGSIDALFYPERLPNPTFGTGGLLWSALTLALLTVPVVIVATEEALAAVPRSMREGSLACGASKWQTIRNIVLPRAMPGIMTGIILAMARGAGEVAPLMLVGVVKLAPELPVDGLFPFVHLERSFMHLGFHIYDVGFQSRNAEAGKPMVFVTTMLLISLIFVMNVVAIVIRNRLRRKFAGSQF